jgi:uncharacterized membrane protein YbhN (UPF0104 family)
MKHLVKILISLACSFLILGLLFGIASSTGKGASPALVADAVRGAIPLFVGVYILCQFAQTFFRALRARLLLKASLPTGQKVPGLFRLILVTFVRGACADMLPARIGELSYVAMLNRGCSIPAADCLSSLSIGLLFDFIALLAVLAVAIPAAAQGMSLLGSMLMLAVICIVGGFGLFFIFPAFAKACARLEGRGLFRKRLFAALLKIVTDTANAVVKTRRGGVALGVTAHSICVRMAKYAGLYCLFVAVTRPIWPDLSQAGIFPVLVALIAAEGAASLPVPTFMSFGSYEAGGLAALTALGFPASDSMAAMIAMHVLSQIIDYSLGGLAFLVFTWTTRTPKQETECVGEQRPSATRKAFVILAMFALTAFVLLFAAFQYRASKKRGRLTPPPVGEAVEPTSEEAAARDAALRAFGGKIVWSSNREGSHDIWILDGPGKEPRRLTHSAFTDTYPRFSPDGRLVSFSRSTEPWVSQRNFEKWDTWVVDVETGRERRVATNAYQACWNLTDMGNSELVFVREGGKTLEGAAPDGGPMGRCLISGQHPLDRGELITLPDMPTSDNSPNRNDLLVTLRGARNATARLAGSTWTQAEITLTAGGCQMVWRKRCATISLPDLGEGATQSEEEVVWVDHPGRMKNAFYTFDYSEPDCKKRKRVVLLDAEEPWSHEYFPRFAEGGRWLVYGASQGGHEQDSEDYEIFLWDSANTNTPPARLTFHTGNDCWPDIWAK